MTSRIRHFGIEDSPVVKYGDARVNYGAWIRFPNLFRAEKYAIEQLVAAGHGEATVTDGEWTFHYALIEHEIITTILKEPWLDRYDWRKEGF